MLKDKQIGDLELKLENVGATAIQDFKDSDEYSDELCKYYVEGFDLLMKWMTTPPWLGPFWFGRGRC